MTCPYLQRHTQTAAAVPLVIMSVAAQVTDAEVAAVPGATPSARVAHGHALLRVLVPEALRLTHLTLGTAGAELDPDLPAAEGEAIVGMIFGIVGQDHPHKNDIIFYCFHHYKRSKVI